MTFKRVVITGLGALTPIGNTRQAYWDGLKNGQSGAAPITKFDTTLFKTKFACELKGFDPANFMDFNHLSRNIVERGDSNNNIFRGNDANIALLGRGSRKQ